MPRSNEEILANLDPGDPASIRALIDFHHATFGDARMEGDDDKGGGDDKGGKDDDAKDKSGGDDKDDKPLGPAGERALQAERDARQQLDSELKSLKAGLAQALGIKSEDAKSTETVVATLQKQVADMAQDNLVLRVASEHKIADAEDLELLRNAPSEEAMRKLAARFAKAGASGKEGEEEKPKDDWRTRGLPKPDPSQGAGGGDARPSSIEAVREQRRAERAKRREQRGA